MSTLDNYMYVQIALKTMLSSGDIYVFILKQTKNTFYIKKSKNVNKKYLSLTPIKAPDIYSRSYKLSSGCPSCINQW
jgi:hypothetical protein